MNHGLIDLNTVLPMMRSDGVNILKVPECAAEIKKIGQKIKATADFATALEEFEAIPEALVYDPMLSNMTLAKATKHDVDAARAFFDCMQEQNFVDTVSFNTLMLTYARSGDWAEVFSLLEAVPKPTVVTFNALINVAVDQKRADRWSLVERMESQGISADHMTLTALLKGVQTVGQKDDLDKLMGYFVEVNTVDDVLVNHLLDACARLRCVNSLRKVLGLMRSKGLKPTAHSCGTLLNMYLQLGNYQQAEQVWKDLLSHFSPGPNEYTMYCEVLCAQGKVEQAVALLLDAKTKFGVSRLIGLYQCLIKFFAGRREVGRAKLLFDEITPELDMVPVVLFNMMLDAWARIGNVDEAEVLWQRSLMLGVTLDAVSYTTLIKAYCVKGDLENALMHFNMFRRRGMKADLVLYHCILDGCSKRQLVMLCEQVVADLLSDGLKPSNVTLSIVVKAYGRTDMERAFELVRTWPREYGFQVNNQVYTCLMSSAFTHGDSKRAMEVFNDMRANDCTPDKRTYRTIVMGLLRTQDITSAAVVGMDAIKVGQLEDDVLENLLFLVSRNRRNDLEAELRAVMEENSVTLAPVRGPRRQQR